MTIGGSTHLVLHDAAFHGGPRMVGAVRLRGRAAEVAQLQDATARQQQVLQLQVNATSANFWRNWNIRKGFTVRK